MDGDEAAGSVERCCTAGDAGGRSSADDGTGWCVAGAGETGFLAVGCGVLVAAAGGVWGTGVATDDDGCTTVRLGSGRAGIAGADGWTAVALWLGGALCLIGALRLDAGGDVFFGGAGSGSGVTSVVGPLTLA